MIMYVALFFLSVEDTGRDCSRCIVAIYTTILKALKMYFLVGSCRSNLIKPHPHSPDEAVLTGLFLQDAL